MSPVDIGSFSVPKCVICKGLSTVYCLDYHFHSLKIKISARMYRIGFGMDEDL